jgi:hypothetical protein
VLATSIIRALIVFRILTVRIFENYYYCVISIVKVYENELFVSNCNAAYCTIMFENHILSVKFIKFLYKPS